MKEAWKEALKTFAEAMAEDTTGSLLLLLGALLVAVGTAGTLGYQNLLSAVDVWGRLGMSAVGILFVAIAVWRAAPEGNRPPRAAKYGFTITSPKPLATLKRATFTGTYRKAPPTTYEARMVRWFPGKEAYYPLGRLLLDPDKRTWECTCDVGTRSGERRYMAVYLVGPSSQVLMNYFKEAADIHNPYIKGETEPKWLPNLKVVNPDMIKCDEVELIIA